MLREVILALLGHHGDVIVPVFSSSEAAVGLVVEAGDAAVVAAAAAATTEEEKGSPRAPAVRKVMIGFQVSRDFGFLSLHEKQAVDQVVQLGFYYLAIQSFIVKHRRPALGRSLGPVQQLLSAGLSSPVKVDSLLRKSGAKSSEASDKPSHRKSMGLYARALCTGLEELLQGYRAKVIEAEQNIVHDPQFPLLKLRSLLADYFVVFPAVQSLLQEISHAPGVRALGGGEILQALYRKSLVGIDALEKVMHRLLYHCHKVLFNQISSWVVNGTLSDPYQEFFIRQMQADKKKVASSQPKPADISMDEKADKFDEAAANELVNHSWHTQFKLRMSMLPDYISVALAEKILFIGKAIHIIHACDLGVTEAEEDEVLGSRPFAASEARSALILSPLLQHEEVVQFLANIQQLREAPVFDPVAVSLAVDKMRACVARLLWELVVNKAHLTAHLEFVKDFFLMGKGDFFQAFVDRVKANDLFLKPIMGRTEQDLNDEPFQAAAALTGVEDDERFARLSIHLDQPKFFFKKFEAAEVCSVERAKKSGVVVLGSSELVGDRIRLTGGGPVQTGGLFSGSRRVVERGFSTKFNFQVTRLNPAAPTGVAPGLVPASQSLASLATANRSLLNGSMTDLLTSAFPSDSFEFSRLHESKNPLLPGDMKASAHLYQETEGFSFVIHNDRLGSLPLVAVARSGVERKTLVYRPCPRSLEVRIHLGCAQAEDSDQVDMFSETASITVLATASPDASDRTLTILGHFSSEDFPVLHKLNDGDAHFVQLVYNPPDSNCKGELLVHFDDVVKPLGKVEVVLHRQLGLDDGRAWVGFSAINGYFADQNMIRLKNRIRFRREIKSWEFSEREANMTASALWKIIELEYRTVPPIDLVLTVDHFDRYNSLFRFLFAAKRTQIELQQLWPWQMQTRKLPANKQVRLSKVFHLRQRMHFFVNNILFYFLADGVEPQHRLLVKRITESNDFESVRLAHDEFIANVSRFCFLHNRVVSRALTNLFEICLALCNLVSRANEFAVNPREVEKLEREFAQQSGLVFKMLSRETGSFLTPSLAQLILRLDFNNFFSTTK